MAAENHIQVLPDHIANKIAAGEVVERPASVVKELLENALDAGGTQVEIRIQGGGKKAILITDNGKGMSRDDALLSVERHATSKIRDVEDIEAVATLGFRGEALAAIASVSRFSLKTRTGDADAGTEVSINAGKMLDVVDAGCPPGTSISVRQLFHNVPARKKFLRAEQTEMSHIRQVFLLYALARPDVGLSLMVDDRIVHQLPAGDSLKDRLRELYGADTAKLLRPIEHTSGEIRVRGFAGTPDMQRSSRSDQYVFINGRPASSPVLHHAISEAYQSSIVKGKHPVLFLFIDMPPGTVDVNVHPTKKEVRFRNASSVRDAVIKALMDAVARRNAVSDEAVEPAEIGSLQARSFNRPVVQIEGLPDVRHFTYPRIPLVEKPGASTETYSDSQPVPTSAAMGVSHAPWSSCRVLGQVGGLYVVLETEDGMVLLDPNAAHERVLYEKMIRESQARSVMSQGLLAPETIEMNPQQALAVTENIGTLKRMGFGISEFGDDTFIVDALPACLGDVSGQRVLLAMAESVDVAGQRGGTKKWSAERIARVACQIAVKSRDRLSVQALESLVASLARCDMPYTCPHGRPTMIFMSFNELNRKFGRT